MTVAEYIFIAFPSILVILNPFMASTSFLSLTKGEKEAKRAQIAKRSCLTAFFILIFFAFAGHLIFQAFDITIEAFRVAGGIVLFSVGWEMLQLKPLRIKQTEEEREESQTLDDIAVVPLAIPILSGPGAITTVMVLTAEINWKSKLVGLLQMSGLLLSCAASLILIYLILLNAEKLFKLFRITVLGVITRIMGLILTVTATQFVINGLKDLLPQLAKLVS